MEGKQITNPVLVIFFILSISFSTALRYQTLYLNSASKQHQTLSRPHKPDDNTLLVELVHRDDLIPPASNITRAALWERRLKRDSLRFKALSDHAIVAQSDSGSPLSSGLPLGAMEYLARVGVGTPANKVYLALDTGSDVVWLQCRPCKKCYEQAGLIFDPRNSSSFSPLPCGDSRCQQLDSADYSNCDNPQSSCLYKFTYGDGSFSFGNLSTETLTFGRTKVDNVALGCGHDNEGLLRGFAGLLGLGRGSLSFPTQTGHRIFSYCLPNLFTNSSDPPSSSSSILFGDSAVPRNANFTPLLHNPDPQLNTFHYVGLKGISVGGNGVPDITPALFKMDSNGNGGVIVDSGTSVTRLTQHAYEALRDAFVKASNLTVISTVHTLFDTCYNFSGMAEVRVPTVELHFDGADMGLPVDNYLVQMDNDGTFCFAFAGTKEGFSIIGNIQQQGFRVSFDMENNQVGFTANGCHAPGG